ncbi:uncharacterized protein LOC111803033 [Cucurbita pepo subsp. pepo]|uniref:uncharacterized protein LOC111803033 n=1 Tax=Cucurbita pepo subsp. pepo TaxID=3664 RepID=UPI000C9D99CB|nr:uncharacterized protein LOC111803033 [Cucurbita pepo subsp. pepo]
MEESASQRDRERERRRIRDRERRSSMTVEQRERHLACRRRNYHLRRLRSRSVRTTNPSVSSPIEMAETNSHQTVAETSIAELDLQRNGLTLIDFNHEQQMTSSGSETLDPKAEILQGRVRLSHIRRLARSIGIHQMMDSMAESTGNCKSEDHSLECDQRKSSKALRLNRVKHLARKMNSSAKPSAAEDESQNQTAIAGSTNL